MKYHTLFFSKIGQDVAKLSSAAVVFGLLRDNYSLLFGERRGDMLVWACLSVRLSIRLYIHSRMAKARILEFHTQHQHEE